MRIAISAGHGGKDPGAVNPRLNLEEHAEAVNICEELVKWFQEDSIPFVCVPYGRFTLKEKIAYVNRAHEESPINLCIEIHFNSNPGEPAHGTEVLYQSVKNRTLAANVSRELAAGIGTTDRGAKQRMNLGWLKQTKPPSLIVEVLFINNDDEAAKVNDEDFAIDAATGIMNGLSGVLI